MDHDTSVKGAQDIPDEKVKNIPVIKNCQAQECASPLSLASISPTAIALHTTPAASLQCGISLNDPRYMSMFQHNHDRLACAMWPGVNVGWNVQCVYEADSLYPYLFYTYYPVESLSTEKELHELHSQSIPIALENLSLENTASVNVASLDLVNMCGSAASCQRNISIFDQSNPNGSVMDLNALSHPVESLSTGGEVCKLHNQSTPIALENSSKENTAPGKVATLYVVDKQGSAMSNQRHISLYDYSIPNESVMDLAVLPQLCPETLAACSLCTLPEESCDEGNKDLGFFGVDGCWYPGCTSKVKEDHAESVHHMIESDVNNTTLVPYNYTHQEKCNFSQYARNKVRGIEENWDKGSVVTSSKRNKFSLRPYNCYHYTDLPQEVLGRPRLIPSFEKDGKPGVENLWQRYMSLLFIHLPVSWQLFSAHPQKIFGHHWTAFIDSAKVRFLCEKCADGWTSMFGVVLFHYRMSLDEQQGMIYYRICGQKCTKCQSNKFELPLWYPEEAQKVITNLYYKVASSVHGLITPRLNSTRRRGVPNTPHNCSLCQGCNIGMCKSRRMNYSSDLG